MKDTAKLTTFSLILLFIVSCGGGGGGDNPPPQPSPSAANLIFPADNTECNEGILLSDSQSTVTFEWDAAANTDSYTLNVRNLNTGQVQSLNTGNTQLDVTIMRGVPYAWWVVSSNSTSQTAQSAEWKFYNAGLAVENYAPFPAGLISPQMGSGTDATGGEVTLVWDGNDVDGDIADYDVYFDTANPPVNLQQAGTTTISLNVSVVSTEIYYWRVITRDVEGNTSTSAVFEFRVN